MPAQIDHSLQNGMILFGTAHNNRLTAASKVFQGIVVVVVDKEVVVGEEVVEVGRGGDGGQGGGGEIGELQLHQLSTVFEGVEGALSIINQSHFGTSRGHRGSGSDMRRRWCKCSTKCNT